MEVDTVDLQAWRLNLAGRRSRQDQNSHTHAEPEEGALTQLRQEEEEEEESEEEEVAAQQWRRKESSRVGGRMEGEAARRRRWLEASEPGAGERSCGSPRALWLPSSCGPGATCKGPGELRPAEPEPEPGGEAGEAG